MQRPTYKRLVKYAMFLLPALLALLAHTTLYDRLYKDADCMINCDDYVFNASRELQLNFKKMMALLNDPSPAKLPTNRAPIIASTQLDLAFLDEKMAGLNNTTLLQNSAALPASNADMVMASDLSNADVDPIGLMQAANSATAKQSITQPDSLAASINGLNPPIIIPAKPQSGASTGIPNSNSGAGITPPNNASPNNGSPNIISPVMVTPVSSGNGNAAISTVPLPSAFYLMLSGLAMLLLYNHSAGHYKDDY